MYEELTVDSKAKTRGYKLRSWFFKVYCFYSKICSQSINRSPCWLHYWFRDTELGYQRTNINILYRANIAPVSELFQCYELNSCIGTESSPLSAESSVDSSKTMSFDDVHQAVCHSTELSRASHDHGSCVGKWRSRAGHRETSPKGGTENKARSRYKTWFLEVVFLVILARMIIDRGSKYQTKNSKQVSLSVTLAWICPRV